MQQDQDPASFVWDLLRWLGLASFVRDLPRWFRFNWWVVLIPVLLLAFLMSCLQQTTPGDPRNEPADDVAKDVKPKIALELDDNSQVLAEGKAVDTADKALDESLGKIANKGVSLLNDVDVETAVGEAVDDAISADRQLKEISVTSIETGVVDSLTVQLTMLPKSIADALPTSLNVGAKKQLADKAVVEVFATLDDQGVPLESESRPQIEDAASQAATNAVAAFELPANVNEDELTQALAEEVGTSVTELGDRVASAVSERDDIAEDDAAAVAGAIAVDVDGKIDDIVEKVVKTGVDPGDAEAVRSNSGVPTERLDYGRSSAGRNGRSHCGGGYRRRCAASIDSGTGRWLPQRTEGSIQQAVGARCHSDPECLGVVHVPVEPQASPPPHHPRRACQPAARAARAARRRRTGPVKALTISLSAP